MTLDRRLGLLALALACALPPVPAAAALVLLDQQRSVRVDVVHREDVFSSCIPLIDPFCQPDSTTITPSGEALSAPDAAPWAATANAPPSTFASQDSSIGGTQIDASGSHAEVSLYSNSGGFPITFVSEDPSGASELSAEFELTEPHAFQLQGSVVTVGGFLSSSSAWVRLTGPGGLVAEVVVASDPDCLDPSCATVGPEPIDVSGNLAPGIYTLEASAEGSAGGLHSTSGSFGSGGSGAFQLSLGLTPPPAVPALPGVARGLLFALLAAPGALALGVARRRRR